MHRTAFLIIAALVPSGVFAGVDLQSTHALEMACREELGIVGVELQPGVVKGNFRRCIRLKTAEIKRENDTIRKRTSRSIQQEEVLEIPETTPLRYDPMLRDTYVKDCRKQLGIGEKEVVQPGPKLGTLKRCIERKTSEANRKNTRRKRDTVLRRSRQISTEEKMRKEAGLERELRRLDIQQRNRLQTQTKANPRRLKAIRESYRVKSLYTHERKDGRAAKKQRAENCRKVSAKKWSSCIREALQ